MRWVFEIGLTIATLGYSCVVIGRGEWPEVMLACAACSLCALWWIETAV